MFATILVAACMGVVTATNADGQAFLKANKVKAGVVTLASGLQYKVLRVGEGQFHPTVDAQCKCHYEGTLIDGTEFDSSYARGEPTSFAPNQVIKGWTEAMQLMVEGDKWEMYIPSDLAYGDRGSSPKIPGGSALIFRMEIIEILGSKVPASRCDPSSRKGCDDRATKYIEKMGSKTLEELEAEIVRLNKLNAQGPLKPELAQWVRTRLGILYKMAANAKANPVTRRPVPERELIVRTTVPSATKTCPKCGRFSKSGRASCCAPGGAWYRNCGGSLFSKVDHKWSEGRNACKPTTPAISQDVCPTCGTISKSGVLSCCARGGSWFRNCGGAGKKTLQHTWYEGIRACKLPVIAAGQQGKVGQQAGNMSTSVTATPKSDSTHMKHGATNSNAAVAISFTIMFLCYFVTRISD